jgi:hypothetical protein
MISTRAARTVTKVSSDESIKIKGLKWRGEPDLQRG